MQQKLAPKRAQLVRILVIYGRISELTMMQAETVIFSLTTAFYLVVMCSSKGFTELILRIYIKLINTASLPRKGH